MYNYNLTIFLMYNVNVERIGEISYLNTLKSISDVGQFNKKLVVIQ